MHTSIFRARYYHLTHTVLGESSKKKVNNKTVNAILKKFEKAFKSCTDTITTVKKRKTTATLQ